MHQNTCSKLDMEIDTGTNLKRDYTPTVSVCYGDEKNNQLDQGKKKERRPGTN